MQNESPRGLPGVLELITSSCGTQEIRPATLEEAKELMQAKWDDEGSVESVEDSNKRTKTEVSAKRQQLINFPVIHMAG